MTRPVPSRPAVGSRVRLGLGAVVLCVGVGWGAVATTDAGGGAGRVAEVSSEPMTSPEPMTSSEPMVAYGAMVPYDTPVPYAERARPRPSGTGSGTLAGESRAGSLPGEGRQRPGRELDGTAAGETAAGETAAGVPEVPVASPPVSAPVKEPGRPDGEGGADGAGGDAGAPDEVGDGGRRAGPVPRILPLGSGLVLIGLGLGLAFVGLRLRRG